MKKIIFIILIPIIIFAIIVTNEAEVSFNPQVYARTVENTAFTGEWVVERAVIYDNKTSNEEEAKAFKKKSLTINNDILSFEGDICREPKFKIKKVQSNSYLWDTFKVKAKALNIEKSTLEVVTIYSNGKYYDDLILIDENHLIKTVNGILLFLKKQGYKEDREENSSVKNLNIIATEKEKEIKAKSGVLIGLKCKDEESESTYRTVWVRYENGTIKEKNAVKDILVPTTSGFSKLGVEENTKNSKDILWIQTLYKQLNNGSYNSIKDNKHLKYLEEGEINFIGDSYLSIEHNLNGVKKMEVLPLDNISAAGISIDKLLGNHAEKIYVKNAEDNKNKAENKGEDTSIDKTDWGIIRRSGRWALRGRLKSSYSNNNFLDFDVSYPVPKFLTVYDEIYPSLDEIKKQQPCTLDAFSSPNRDFIVILTEDKLLLCSINNKAIIVKDSIPLKSKETVVMLHWATGSYVDEWSKKVK